MRYLVEDSKGYVVAVFMFEEGANQYIELINNEGEESFRVIHIRVEDIHIYM